MSVDVNFFFKSVTELLACQSPFRISKVNQLGGELSDSIAE
jgi:hypothetical protein